MKPKKKLKLFHIAVLDYRNNQVRMYIRRLPEDIQTEELEVMLEDEGNYNSDCYIMFSREPIDYIVDTSQPWDDDEEEDDEEND